MSIIPWSSKGRSVSWRPFVGARDDPHLGPDDDVAQAGQARRENLGNRGPALGRAPFKRYVTRRVIVVANLPGFLEADVLQNRDQIGFECLLDLSVEVEVAQPVEQPVHGHHQRALPATLQTALRLAEPGAELVEGAVPIERRHHVRRDLVEFVPDSGSDQGSKFCARSVAPGGGDAAGGAGSGGHAAALVPAGPWPAAFPSVPPGAG